MTDAFHTRKIQQTNHKVKTPDSKKHTFQHTQKGSVWSAFSYYPKRVKFVNEDPEERIILMLRSHPITNLSWVISVFFMVFVPSFAFVIPPLDELPINYQNVLSLVWYLIMFTFAFERFLSWFFHVNIITDERIVEVDFHGLLHREITDANIDRIEDVTVEMGGGLQTILNYGNVYIQTAAEVPRVQFEAIPYPDKVAKILRQLRVEEEQEKLEGRVR